MGESLCSSPIALHSLHPHGQHEVWESRLTHKEGDDVLDMVLIIASQADVGSGKPFKDPAAREKVVFGITCSIDHSRPLHSKSYSLRARSQSLVLLC